MERAITGLVYAVRQTGRIRAWWKAIPLRRMCAPPPDRRRVILRGHPDIQAQRDRIGNPERATASRMPANTRLLHACRCAAGRCCRAAAAPRPSRQRRRRTIGWHRPFGFPRSARSGGRRRAARDAEFPKEVAAASAGVANPSPRAVPANANL